MQTHNKKENERNEKKKKKNINVARKNHCYIF